MCDTMETMFLEGQIERLEGEVKQLRVTLGYFADAGNWHGKSSGAIWLGHEDRTNESDLKPWKLAQEALKATE